MIDTVTMYLLMQWSLPITDPVFIFALVMLIILVAPILFARMKIPGIVGLIVAGIIVGPNATGLLERDQTIELLGTVGLLYIMFVAGLEINLNQFIRYRNRSLTFGTITFMIPQVTGTLLAVYLLGFNWTAAILLASMFASHTLLAYPIASRFGIARSESVTTTVGGTIITDTAALMVLAIIAGSVEGTLNAAFWVRLTVSMAVFVLLVFWALPRVGRWFFRSVSDESAAEFVFVLAAVFISALFSEFAGMEPIIGAFLAGLALNRLIPEQSTLMNRIHFVGNSLFIPFFLISVGMLVDLGIFAAGLDAWTVSGFMVTIVILTKFVAAKWTQRIFRYSKEEGMVIFGLSVSQAAATLAAVIIGYDLGIFGDAVLNGAIAMILVTCLLGPWVVERFGRSVALAEERKPYQPEDAPQRILVPLSNPATAESLMNMALLLRSTGHDEPIYPMAVAQEGHDTEARVAACERLLGNAVVHGAGAEVPVQPVTRIDMNVANAIVRAIRELRISDVVIGWSGQVSPSERIFGTVLDQLLDETREEVFVCKLDSPVNTLDRVVLTVPRFAERESGFEKALGSVKSLANQLGAELFILAAADSVPVLEATVSAVRPELTTRFEPLESWGDLWPTLVETVTGHDLIVVLSARERTISWTPMLDRLPRMIVQSIPDANVLVVYPGEMTHERPGSGWPSDRLLGVAGTHDEHCVAANLTGADPPAIIVELLESAFGHDVTVLREVKSSMAARLTERPAELQPGIVLYHTHAAGISEPLVIAGLHRSGVSLAQDASPAYVVLLVISPTTMSAQEHLRRMATLAQSFREPNLAERLRGASSADELCDLLGSASAAAV